MRKGHFLPILLSSRLETQGRLVLLLNWYPHFLDKSYAFEALQPELKIVRIARIAVPSKIRLTENSVLWYSLKELNDSKIIALSNNISR